MSATQNKVKGLYLHRLKGQSFDIVHNGETVTVSVQKFNANGSVTLRVSAPPHVQVKRDDYEEAR